MCDILEPREHTQVATIRTSTLCCSRLRVAALPIVKHQHTDLSLLFSQVADHRVASVPRLVIAVYLEAQTITSQGETANQHPCRARAAKITVAPQQTDFSHSPILTERATSTCNHAMRSIRNLYTPATQ